MPDLALLVLVAVLAVSAVGSFLLWVAGRLRKASAYVDAVLGRPDVYPGSAAHRVALRSVEDGTAPSLSGGLPVVSSPES